MKRMILRMMVKVLEKRFGPLFFRTTNEPEVFIRPDDGENRLDGGAYVRALHRMS